MALQSIGHAILPVHPPLITGGAPSLSNTLLVDAAGEKCTVIFPTPKTGNLDQAEFRWGIVTTPQTIRVSFQDVDPATGFPDETADQFRDVTPISNTWQAPGLITSDGTDGGVKRSVTVGQPLAVVWEYPGTVGNLSVSAWTASGMTHGYPYCALKSAGPTWAFATSVTPIIALKYDDGSYEWIGGDAVPVMTWNATGFNSGSTPDERALLFTLPVPVTISGGYVYGDFDGDFDLVLYDGTTALASCSFDKDIRFTSTACKTMGRFAPQNLLANTPYRLAVKPTSVTTLTLYNFDVNAAGLMGAAPGGALYYGSTRTDAGAWTDVTTNRPLIFPIATKFGDDAGSGGSVPAGRQIPIWY